MVSIKWIDGEKTILPYGASNEIRLIISEYHSEVVPHPLLISNINDLC